MKADANFEKKILALIADAVPSRNRKVRITKEARLQRDLGIDSIGVAALVFRLEEAFGLDLAEIAGDVDVSKLRTVEDAVTLSRQIVERAGGRS